MPMSTSDATRAAIAMSCGLTRSHRGFCSDSSRTFGVTRKPSGLPRNTFSKALVTDSIHTGNSASEYCCPRHVGLPAATTQNRPG